MPTSCDRILATRFGVLAGRMAVEGRFGQMVALHGNRVEPVSIQDAICRQKLVKPDNPLVSTARSIGTSFGDEV